MNEPGGAALTLWATWSGVLHRTDGLATLVDLPCFTWRWVLWNGTPALHLTGDTVEARIQVWCGSDWARLRVDLPGGEFYQGTMPHSAAFAEAARGLFGFGDLQCRTCTSPLTAVTAWREAPLSGQCPACVDAELRTLLGT